MFRRKKNNEDKTLYGDITNRLFALGVDLLILYFPIKWLSALIIAAYFPVANQFEVTRDKVLAVHPELATDFQSLVNYMTLKYPQDMVAIMRETVFAIVIQVILMGLYIIPLTWRYGATPGKKLMGLEVIDCITREKITLSQSIIRFLAYIPSTGLLMLGFISGGVRHNKRCWQDYIADTMVIYTPNRWYKQRFEALKISIKTYLNLK